MLRAGFSDFLQLARAGSVVFVLLLSAVSCSDDGQEGRSRAQPDGGGCGLPAVEDSARVELVPDEFLLEEPAVEVAQTYRRRQRFVATLNVMGSVQDSFTAYKASLAESRFDLLQEDNEGFEAELYLQRGPDFGVIQIRSSKCDDQSLVILNLPGG